MKRIFNFIFILIVSFLAFDGLEHLLELHFGIDLHSLLAFGGVASIIILGFKFHIFCCVLPAIVSTIFCIRKRQKHCEHDHEGN